MDETAPGYRHAVLAPMPGGGLTHAETSLQTPYGLLSLKWKATDGGIELNITVPSNATATLVAPEAYGGGTTELGSGEHRILWQTA